MQERVRVQINGVWRELSINEETGKYEAELSAPERTSYGMEEGAYIVSVEAIESHGLPSEETYSLTVREAEPPEIQFSGLSEYINENQPTIEIKVSDEETGSGVKGESLSITVDNGTPQQGEIWSPPQGVLTEGRHTVTARAEDNDGNKAEKTISFVVDTEPPELTITEPANGINVNRGAVVIKGIVSDKTSGVSSVRCTINKSEEQEITNIATDGTIYWAQKLKKGENHIVICAEDKAGNRTEKSVLVRTENDWIDPIWWRTEDDIERAKLLNEIVGDFGLKQMRPDEQIEYKAGLLACLNEEDLNRIEYDTKWLYERLYQAGYGFGPQSHKTDWEEKDYPYAEEMERIRSGVQGLIDTYYPQGVVLPESLTKPHYEDINAAERILYEMKGMIELMEQSYVYCGVPYCGQGVSL